MTAMKTLLNLMGLGAEKTDDRWRHPEEYDQYGILSWMTSELVSMIWTLLYGSTSAENVKYVLKIGLKFVPNLRFFFLRGCLCLWLHQEIFLFSEYQLSSWEALTSFSLKIQLLKILSLLHLKSCDVRILLDEIFKMMVLLRSENVKRTLNPPWYFIIRGSGNTQDEKCWSLMKLGQRNCFLKYTEIYWKIYKMFWVKIESIKAWSFLFKRG